MTAFAEFLSDYLGRLEELRRLSASEDTIRDAFLHFLRQAFPRLEEAEPILLEHHLPGIRVRGGFADALFGDLIFEFKRRLDEAHRKTGREELERYLLSRPEPERFSGILTDGETLEVYVIRDGRLRSQPVDTLRLGGTDPERAHLWLDCYLFHERHLKPTAADVALRFGERSPVCREALRLLGGLWSAARGLPWVRTRFAQWRSLLAIVYGTEVGEEELFLRHTYLALFARVLAFLALLRRTPRPEELSGLVDGSAFEAQGLENFVADDFFGWVAADPGRAAGLLGDLSARLQAAYDLGAVNEDLLKELYQELVDPRTRHDLGEFYTPDWLAELLLRRAGFGERPGSLLDPACGSGTFLFTAVRLLKEAGFSGGELVEFCRAKLAGVDIHPLAVTIARANLVLALGENLRSYGRRLELPVYMADSLLLPEGGKATLGGPRLKVAVPVQLLAGEAGKPVPSGLPRAFELPALGDAGQFGAVVEALTEFARPDFDEAAAREGFSARLSELGITDEAGALADGLRLMRWLLSEPPTDTVWGFVLRNACRPLLFSRRRFEYVVGNPPWLSYRYIGRSDYQARVRRLTFEYGLLGPKAAHLFTQLELATLFFAVAADRYLAEGGTLAFVMPRSILTGAKQHEAFRQRYLGVGARLIIDCEGVEPLFNVPACAVVWAGGKGPSEPVVERLSGTLPHRNADYRTALRSLSASRTAYAPAKAARASPYLEKITNGACLYPRCLWFVRPAEAVVVDRRRPWVETAPEIDPKAKEPWKGIRLRGQVEAEFLFATLLSDELLPFGFRRLALVVLPLSVSPGRLIGWEEALRLGKTGLADWLRQADGVWRRLRKSAEELLRYLDWQGKLTRQRVRGVYKLLYNATGSRIFACVVDLTKTPLDLQVSGLPVQGFVAQHKQYWFETPDALEAHYLCAVLNAPVTAEAIRPFQPKGLFGERGIERRPFEVLPIPRFDPADPIQRRLAELSLSCHRRVAQLCGSDPDLARLPIGPARRQVREALAAELAEIDTLTRELVGPAPDPGRR